MSKEKLTYEQAIAELEEIVNEMESGDISVDELSEKIKRSSVLIKYCKQKLKTTEEDVAKILEELGE
jgi:exodeoxyribonuclease VII small subunit